MKRKIITTADGSKTIQIEEWNEQYHSVHGAINEANHVYLKHGLLFFNSEFEKKNICHSEQSEESQKNNISILEMGFGTGLNAFLTFIEAEKLNLNVSYVGVEAYPVVKEELDILNYAELISPAHKTKFEELHAIPWNKHIQISDVFKLKKEQKFFKDISYTEAFNVIYFDAFGPRVQPELWTEAIFKLMYKALKPNGVLVTYSVQGTVKRALRAVGFTVNRLQGPPNKRHMLRAIKR